MRVLPLGSVALLFGLTGCPSDPEFEPWVLEELTAEQGFSLRIPESTIAPGKEDQNCFFVRVPDLAGGEDFWVERIRMAMNPGSHHLNVFRVRTQLDLRPDIGTPVKLGDLDGHAVYGGDDWLNHPCWKSANWADWPLVANSQNSAADDPYTDWQLPEGVAVRFTPGELLMIQTHYVNTTLQATPFGGKVGINFHRSTKADPMELGTLFATQQSLRVCQSTPPPTYSGTCRFPGAVTVTAANGHFHARGKRFSMFTWDGRSIDHPPAENHFYTSESWDHPEMLTGIERAVPQGGGVWWNCEFRWVPPVSGCDEVNARDPQQQGDCCYVFGGNTDLSEHCNIFLYYYPKMERTDVFCN